MSRLQAAVPAKPNPLLAKAQKLWPDSEFNQRAWLRGVRLARQGRMGWLCDPGRVHHQGGRHDAR
jgi:hypothetical protein